LTIWVERDWLQENLKENKRLWMFKRMAATSGSGAMKKAKLKVKSQEEEGSISGAQVWDCEEMNSKRSYLRRK